MDNAPSARANALVKGPKPRGQLFTSGSLDVQTDHPIQGPFHVVAAFIPGQAEETLPPKFLQELVMQHWPWVCEAEDTIRDSSITRALPLVLIGDVEI